eukprot:c4170_g1_i1.p1 GENE.c4170_g1_i1~~c4170_g1_i1.p1  ORF type:complete len:548 (+),score=168.88 c4170_g1_i1:35-1645(+)
MTDQRLSREDYKAQQALEEARKAGTAPPEVDEDGNAINPHIPQYISQAPWYLENIRRPGLKHQRRQDAENRVAMDVWYKKGLDAKGEKVKRFKQGSCQNCGATTHTSKECLERPRKTGAQFDESKLGRQDVVTALDLDYDAKRDRWNGFDPSTHHATMQRYNLYEAERKKVKQQQLATEPSAKDADDNDDNNKSDSDSDVEKKDDDIHEEYRQDEAQPMSMSKRETATISVRTTVRDLRIREDTAKYLLNLDVNSAYFDPKTRSMRDDPLKGVDDSERLYRGDNYVRNTGQVNDFNNLQVFAWQAQDKGQQVHAQGLPSQAEAMHRQFHSRKQQLKEDQQSTLISKYGGEEHLQSLPKPLLWGQSEDYVEYSASGKVIKGQEKAIPKSKYEEDVYPSNHASVWGSYWENGRWGYACCRHLARNAYCTAKSEHAALEAARQQALMIDASKTAVAGIDFEKPQPKSKSSKSKSTDADEAERLRAALEKEDHRNRHPEELDDRKRKFNSMSANDTEVTPEDMEAWRMKRAHWEDPLSHM